jgi:EpsI family protein
MTTAGFGSVTAVVAILSTTLIASGVFERHHPEKLTLPLDGLPRALAGWRFREDTPLPPDTLKRLVTTDHCSRIYVKGRAQLGLFIAYYAEQRSGESMHSPKHCLPGSGWEIWKYGSAAIPVDGRSEVVNNYSVQKAGTRDIVLYWYQSRERIIASEFLGKVLLMRDALLSGRTDGALVRIVLPDQPGAVGEGVAFASALIPEVQRCFGQ